MRTRMLKDSLDLFLPTEVFNLPIGLTFSEPPLKGVNISLSGPAAILDRLEKRQLQYPLDLSETREGANPLAISVDALEIPPGVTIEQVLPVETVVKLENAQVKNLAVTPNLVGKPADGFTVVDALVEPSAVTISGPRSLIDPLQRIRTKAVPIDGISESFKKDVALDLPESVSIRTASGVVVIDIRIAERIETRTWENIRIGTNTDTHTVHISPPNILLEIRGPAGRLARLNFESDRIVFVDTATLKPGVYVRRATIQLPVGMTLIKANPDFFTVTVSPKRSSAAPPRPLQTNRAG